MMVSRRRTLLQAGGGIARLRPPRGEHAARGPTARPDSGRGAMEADGRDACHDAEHGHGHGLAHGHPHGPAPDIGRHAVEDAYHDGHGVSVCDTVSV